MPKRRPRGQEKNQKVTARFSRDEYEVLLKSAKKRGASTSRTMRELVLRTIDEAAGKRRKR